jgi:hypothetical protein
MKIRRAKIVLVVFVAFLVALVALADSGHGQQLFQLARKVLAATSQPFRAVQDTIVSREPGPARA